MCGRYERVALSFGSNSLLENNSVPRSALVDFGALCRPRRWNAS